MHVLHSQKQRVWYIILAFSIMIYFNWVCFNTLQESDKHPNEDNKNMQRKNDDHKATSTKKPLTLEEIAFRNQMVSINCKIQKDKNAIVSALDSDSEKYTDNLSKYRGNDSIGGGTFLDIHQKDEEKQSNELTEEEKVLCKEKVLRIVEEYANSKFAEEYIRKIVANDR